MKVTYIQPVIHQNGVYTSRADFEFEKKKTKILYSISEEYFHFNTNQSFTDKNVQKWLGNEIKKIADGENERLFEYSEWRYDYLVTGIKKIAIQNTT